MFDQFLSQPTVVRPSIRDCRTVKGFQRSVDGRSVKVYYSDGSIEVLLSEDWDGTKNDSAVDPETGNRI